MKAEVKVFALKQVAHGSAWTNLKELKIETRSDELICRPEIKSIY